MPVPILHLTEGNVLCRVPPKLRGKRFSVVSLGLCNFKCGYCYLGGGIERRGVVFPNAKDMESSEVEDFIRLQVAKGNPIKISGGEPTLAMEQTLHFVELAKSLGGYVCVDSSGWSPEASYVLAKLVDQLAIDVKGPRRYVERLTAAKLRLCWHNPIESIRRVAGVVPVLEVRTPVFGFTRIEDLKEIREYIPEQAFWVIRRFITYWVPFGKYSASGWEGFGNPVVTYPAWLTSPPVEALDEWAKELINRDPTLENRLVILRESPRDDAGVSDETCDQSSATTTFTSKVS